MKCRLCEKEINIRDVYRMESINGALLGTSCKDCGKQTMRKVKEKYFVEEYKGNKIYMKGGRYVPYWGCHYYFKSLGDVKSRIDMPNIAVMP